MERNKTCRDAAAVATVRLDPGVEPEPRRNAFDETFLARLKDEDQPPTALAAAREGPWTVAPNGHGRWAVFRDGEGYAAGDTPAALFAERSRALLAAAALPGAAARGTLRLDDRRLPGGYAVSDGRRTVGQLAWFDPDLVRDLAALVAIVSSPRSLAHLLAAAGHDALERAGRILASELDRPSGG